MLENNAQVAGSEPLTAAEWSYWSGFVAGWARILELLDAHNAHQEVHEKDRKQARVILAVAARLRYLEEQEAPWEPADAAFRTCRVCQCTDRDCSQCVEKTGEPCWWVESDLCSACVEEVKP